MTTPQSCRSGLSLIEVMISVFIMSILGIMLTQFLQSATGIDATLAAKDELTDDIRNVHRILDDDLSQSLWYSGDTTKDLAQTGLTFADDRGMAYFPYVFQAKSSASAKGTPSHSLLSIYAGMARPGQLTLRGKLAMTDTDLEAMLKKPGTIQSIKDWDKVPSDFPGVMYADNYRDSYFTPSQDLIFVRTAGTTWDQAADAPVRTGTTNVTAINHSAVQFDGTTDQWLRRESDLANQGEGGVPDKDTQHFKLKTLWPSGYYQSTTSPGTWYKRTQPKWSSAFAARDAALPYGVVMDAAIYDTSGSQALALTPQLERNNQADFQRVLNGDINSAQTNTVKTDVRFFSYHVIPSPMNNGMGRLVQACVLRNKTTNQPRPIPTSIPNAENYQGRYLAKENNDYVVIQKVISDNVVRIVFETARHTDDLGINNIRATVFFAKPIRRSGDNVSVLKRSVTMIFCMRGANTANDQVASRTNFKPGGQPATGAIPFNY